MTPFRNRVEQVSKKDAERGSAALALGSHLKTQIQNKSHKNTIPENMPKSITGKMENDQKNSKREPGIIDFSICSRRGNFRQLSVLHMQEAAFWRLRVPNSMKNREQSNPKNMFENGMNKHGKTPNIDPEKGLKSLKKTKTQNNGC